MADRVRLFATALVAFLLVFSTSVSAQFIRHMNAHQMLRASSVYHVVSDRSGFLWFCTDRGLAKFDGHSTVFFTRREGLGDDLIFNIYQDRQGRIWPFCYNGRYCFIDGDSLHNESNDPWLRSLPHGYGYIKSMAQDVSGNLRFGFSTHSILRLSKGAKPQLEPHLAELDNLEVTDTAIRFVREVAYSVLSDDRRHRLVSDLRGLKIYLGSRVVWQLDDSSLTQRTVNDLFLTSRRQLLVSTINGLEIIPLDGGRRLRLLQDIRVSSCHPDAAGNFWITALNHGVYFLHREAADIRPLYGIADLDFSAVNDGRLVFIKDRVLQEIRSRGDSLTTVPVAGNLPNYYNPVFLSENWTIVYDTWAKVSRLIFRDGPVERSHKIVVGLPSEDFLFFKKAHLRNGRDMFAYGAHHVYQYLREGNRLRFVDTLIHHGPIDASGQDPADGAVYYAAEAALYRYDFTRHQPATLLRDDRLRDVSSISFSGGVVFLLNGERRLYSLDLRANPLRLVPVEPGFPVRSFSPLSGDRAFFASDGMDYLGTGLNSGTLRVMPLRYPFASPYYERIAFIGNKCLVRVEGRTYYFDTGLLNKHLPEARVYVRKLSINGKESDRTDIDVYNTTRLDIQLSIGLLGYGDNASGVRYRLLGPGDSSWQQTQATELAFVLRKAGTYELQLGSEDAPESNALRIRINIHTPFLRSVPFYIICGVLVLAIGALLGLMMVRYRRRHFVRELDYLRLEHRAINALLNPHFIFNSINNIQGLINRSEKHEAAEYLAVLSRLIRQNLENLQFNLIPLENELALIERYLRLQNLRFSETLDLSIDTGTVDAGQVHVPPLLLHTFVENAILHGFRPGRRPFRIGIRVRELDADYLEIRISDNGVGIAAQPERSDTDGHQSMGISFNRKRLARLSEFYRLRQSIIIRNLEREGGNGTEVVIILCAGLVKLLNSSAPTVR